jgi:hypothetical protein
MTTVRRARLSASAVITTPGRVLLISLPCAGSRFTHQISPRRTVISPVAGAIALRHRRFFGGSSNPSSIVAISHSAISAASSCSFSTANAAWYNGSSSLPFSGGRASSSSRWMNLLRCRTATLRLNRLTSASGRRISNCVVAKFEASLIAI